MFNKRKVFYNYLSSETFALLLNSYIRKVTSYPLKIFFLLYDEKKFFMTT